MPQTLVDDLATYLTDRPKDPEALVFTAPMGGPLRHRDFYRTHFRTAVAKAGLPERTRFHDLRHTCAALLIRLGAHPKLVCDFLGHSTITVTMDRYGHLFDGASQHLAAGLDQLVTSTRIDSEAKVS